MGAVLAHLAEPEARGAGGRGRRILGSRGHRHRGDQEVDRDSIEQGTSLRGASTITQQLAKNLYLSPSRDPLRKLRELIITRRLEAALPKARIFEIYLNVIEWGDGIWGAEAAARTLFRRARRRRCRRDQAALLAGAIINPRVYSPAHPPARLLRRQQIILARMAGRRTAGPGAGRRAHRRAGGTIRRRAAARRTRRPARPSSEQPRRAILRDEPAPTVVRTAGMSRSVQEWLKFLADVPRS